MMNMQKILAQAQIQEIDTKLPEADMSNPFGMESAIPTLSQSMISHDVQEQKQVYALD
tara:strand:+ start:274 stop:447 length:174 start_codon:yes stop_codon:yes gene_type:complete